MKYDAINTTSHIKVTYDVWISSFRKHLENAHLAGIVFPSFMVFAFGFAINRTHC